MRGAALVAPFAGLLLAGAAPVAGFHAGLWEIRNEPGGASLDGRPLVDLPIGDIKSESVCMTAADAAAPDKWLVRDNPGCTMTRSRFAGGKIDVAGTCPAAGDARPGKLTLAGTWAPERFDLHFQTLVQGGNGLMGFNGTMTGKRLGACPAP